MTGCVIISQSSLPLKKGKSLSVILCIRQTSRGFQNKTSLEILRMKGTIKRKEHILCTEAFRIPSSAF